MYYICPKLWKLRTAGFIYEDVSLIGNKRYTYKVMALHFDGTTSHISNAVSAKFD
jgi:hypothetical protein